MKEYTIVHAGKKSKRIDYGLQIVEQILKKAGNSVGVLEENEILGDYRRIGGWKIYAGVRGKSEIISRLEESEVLAYNRDVPTGEGFYIATLPGKFAVISGASETGALYGCLELARRIEEDGGIAQEIAFGDAPVFKLRGPVVGLQKTKIEPPRQTYEYPVTCERFPWFYDRQLWLNFLNRMVMWRCNVLYIWSGHPFSSFVKLPEYPEALEVSEEQFTKNVELFKWLTDEADRRGIWVVMKFYNIHIPLPFARRHNIELHQSKPTALTSDYTRKSIAKFIESFSNVGLMVCLGEALRGINYEVDWFVNTILPGVKDGMKAAGLSYEPPVILRAHDTDPFAVMAAAKKVYSNIYTMWKYNGESLTTWLPRGDWQENHQKLSQSSSMHIVNVHILADLEPFRYGSPSFIQKCMLAAKYRLGASGLHLYPLFFWDWPYSPDKTSPRLRQIDRDKMWYDAWFRYAWNPERDPELEKTYWSGVLAEQFGSKEAGRYILKAYEAAGECAPRLLRRFGITEGNRQTLSLGMLMSQLTDPQRYSPCTELWKSASPQGERLDEYVQRGLENKPHIGETPADTVQAVEAYARSAVSFIEKAGLFVKKDLEEFGRLKTDFLAIRYMTYSYTNRVRSAERIIRYRSAMDQNAQGDLSLLDEADSFMRAGMEWYEKLAALTEKTYLYANSMQTRQRKIPIPDGEKYDHWTACLPVYRKELENFENNLQNLKQGILPEAVMPSDKPILPYGKAPFRLLDGACEKYVVQKGSRVFSDTENVVESLAEELNGLTGIRFCKSAAMKDGVTLNIELEEDSRILVGYFDFSDANWLQVEKLEFNAHADDHGELATLLKNAVSVSDCRRVNIHTFIYKKGKHSLFLGKGAFMVAGVIPAGQEIFQRDVENGNRSFRTLDWMYE